jgi:pimeloyl-ACP methyl ester carboxylesterase
MLKPLMRFTAHHPFRSESAKRRYLDRYAQRAAAWPVPSTERIVETSFGRTFVRVSGPAQTSPLLLLPGIGSPGLSLSTTVQALSERHATYTIDNIHDNGRSVESRPVKSADDFTGWLDELCKGLGLDGRVDLLGLSYGGWIFAHCALRFPERVRKLVLLAPAGTVAPIPWGFIWRGILCVIPARFLMDNFMDWIRVTDDVDPRAKRRLDEMADDAWLAHRCFKPRRMVAPIPLTDDQWKSLRVPTLLLAGDREVIFPAEASLKRVAALSPQVTTELMAGTGHDFFVVRADELSRRVLAFLECGT